MGRAHSSKQNKALGLFFANAVTVPTNHRSPLADTIGRCGAHSIFEIFAQVCPKATRDYSRDGVTSTELNKVLEQDGGFERVRVRAVERQIMGKIVPSSNCYRFGRRRWLNPDDPHDMAAICMACRQMQDIDSFSESELVRILRETNSAEDAQMWSMRIRHHADEHRTSPRSVKSEPCQEAVPSGAASEADTDERSSRPSLDEFASGDDQGARAWAESP
eukprot:921199-Rhodomonas_salina.1